MIQVIIETVTEERRGVVFSNVVLKTGTEKRTIRHIYRSNYVRSLIYF